MTPTYKFSRYTNGLNVSHNGRAKLVKAEIETGTDGTLRLTAVSGHNLSKCRGVSPVIVDSLNEDAYDDTMGALSALQALGFSV